MTLRRNDRRVQRRTEAEARAAAFSKLSLKARLTRLDSMFGKGQGAQRERDKLATLIQKEKEAKAQEEG